MTLTKAESAQAKAFDAINRYVPAALTDVGSMTGAPESDHVEVRPVVVYKVVRSIVALLHSAKVWSAPNGAIGSTERVTSAWSAQPLLFVAESV